MSQTGIYVIFWQKITEALLSTFPTFADKMQSICLWFNFTFIHEEDFLMEINATFCLTSNFLAGKYTYVYIT